MQFAVSVPFTEHMGFELRRLGDGEADVEFAPRAEHLNSFGVVHGGASMTLLDVTMAAAARTVQPELGAVTIEMKTSFMRPARGLLTGKGRLLERTKSLAFVEASIIDAQGRLCAHATGTFKYVRRASTPVGVVAAGVISTD